MSKGFTLIELMIVIVITLIIGLIVISNIRGCTSSSGDDWQFKMADPQDIKLIVDPKTGITSECIRPNFSQEWKCRPINVPQPNIEKE